MDKKYIEQHSIDIKYLRNQLTPEENEEFEVYLLEHPDMLEQLELDNALMKAMPEVSIKQQSTSGSSLLSWISLKSFASGALASAAVMTFAIIGLEQASVTQSQNILLVANRSINTTQQPDYFEPIGVQPGGSSLTALFRSNPFVVLIDPAVNESTAFKADISRVSGAGDRELVASITNLNGEPFQHISLVLDGRDYPVGKYVISLKSLEGENETTQYGFEVVLNP